MPPPASTPRLGYNVDALAPCPNGLLVAGCSNFIGPRWTGAVAVLAAGADGAGPKLLTLLECKAGVPAVACLHQADEFTGRRVVASGNDAGSVDLWLLSTSGGVQGAPLEHTQAQALHDAGVAGVAAATAAPQLASASADGTVRLWDAGNLLRCTTQLGGGGAAALHAVAWTAPQHVLASAGHDGCLCLWDTRQAGGSSSAPAAAAAVGAPALSLVAAGSSGHQPLLVAGDQLGRLTVFDARSLAAPLQQRQLHADAVHALAAGAGSGPVASGGDDGSIALLDCSRLEASRQLVPPREDGQAPCYVRALAWVGSQQQQQQQQLFRGGWDQAVAAVAL